MSEELKNCPICECEAWTPTGIFGKPGRKCSECDFETYISFWDKFPRITPHERQWMELAPQFDDDGQTDIMFNEVAVEDDAFWNTESKIWCIPVTGETYAVICRKKQPAWEVGDGFELSDGSLFIVTDIDPSGKICGVCISEGTHLYKLGHHDRWNPSQIIRMTNAELLRLAADLAEGETD